MCRIGDGPLPHRPLEGDPVAGRSRRRRPDGSPPALAEVPGSDRRPRHAGKRDGGRRLPGGLGPGRLGRAAGLARRSRAGRRRGARGRLPGPPHEALPPQARLTGGGPGGSLRPPRAPPIIPPANEGQGTPRCLLPPLRGPAPLAPPHHRQPPGAHRGRAGSRPLPLRRLGGHRGRAGCCRRARPGAGGRRVTWLGQPTLLAILLGYLIFLFLVASAGETFAHRLARGRIRTVTSVRAASVYCTAWTFYGSVGLAANRGLEFLTIYLGPACVALLWPVLLRKLRRVSKEQRITSISDFISSRYGKSAHLGTLVAVLVVAGMIPYIALPLRAVSASFTMILHEGSVLNVFDPTLLVAVTLALFGILFGARNLDFTKQQTGLMTAVAVESVVKLVAFLAVDIYVTWGIFGGPGEIFGRIAADPQWSRLLTIDQPQTASYARWAAMLLISMMAVMFLPRQFHVLVVQNPRERDVNAVAWSFPLYLLLINLFVLPIAFAGLLVFPESGAQADGFILRLPLYFDSHLISVVVFLGGFSAATAMIVVDSLALSKMVTNDIILPMLLRRRQLEDIYWVTLFYTRLAMLVIVGFGFAWARRGGGQLLLVEMGVLFFLAV